MKKLFALLFILISVQLLSRPDINWTSPPTTLSSAGVNASNPLIAVDVNGNTTAAWIESGVLKSSTLPFGGSWSSATTISGSTASSAILRVDGSGNVTAAWVQNGVVTMASLPFGGSWSAASSISSSGASSPTLAVDATGNIVLVWVRNGFIETSTKLFGGLLNVVQMLSSNGTESSPDVYIGSGGKVVAVWGSVVSGNDALYFATKQVNGIWSTQATVLPASASLHHKFAKVIVDQNGNATAIWYRYKFSNSSFSNVQVLSAQLLSGTASWVSPVAFSDQGLRDPSTLYNRLKVDSNGNILAVWTNSLDGETFVVIPAILSFGASYWSTSFLDLGDLYAFEADAAVTSAGNAVATYMSFDGTNINIQSTESDIAGTLLNFWSTPTTLSTGADNGYAKVAINLSNSTIFGAATWIGNNGTNNVIQVVTGTATALAPPTGLSVTQNSTSFGVYTDYYNTINWTDSISSNIMEYLIYRNGTRFATVPFGITQVIDHNAVQNGTVTYGIATVDNTFSLSPMATVNFP